MAKTTTVPRMPGSPGPQPCKTLAPAIRLRLQGLEARKGSPFRASLFVWADRAGETFEDFYSPVGDWS